MKSVLLLGLVIFAASAYPQSMLPPGGGQGGGSGQGGYNSSSDPFNPANWQVTTILESGQGEQKWRARNAQGQFVEMSTLEPSPYAAAWSFVFGQSWNKSVKATGSYKVRVQWSGTGTTPTHVLLRVTSRGLHTATGPGSIANNGSIELGLPFDSSSSGQEGYEEIGTVVKRVQLNAQGVGEVTVTGSSAISISLTSTQTGSVEALFEAGGFVIPRALAIDYSQGYSNELIYDLNGNPTQALVDKSDLSRRRFVTAPTLLSSGNDQQAASWSSVLSRELHGTWGTSLFSTWMTELTPTSPTFNVAAISVGRSYSLQELITLATSSASIRSTDLTVSDANGPESAKLITEIHAPIELFGLASCDEFREQPFLNSNGMPYINVFEHAGENPVQIQITNATHTVSNPLTITVGGEVEVEVPILKKLLNGLVTGDVTFPSTTVEQVSSIAQTFTFGPSKSANEEWALVWRAKFRKYRPVLDSYDANGYVGRSLGEVIHEETKVIDWHVAVKYPAGYFDEN